MPSAAKQHGRPRSAPTRPNSTARGYGYDWQRARLAHLAEHPLCVMCEAEGEVEPAVDVDHKIPHRGNERLRMDPRNWQSLCKRHHGIKSAGER